MSAMSASLSASSSASSGTSIPIVAAPQRPATHVLSARESHPSTILERLKPYTVASLPHEAVAELDVSHTPLGDDGARTLLAWLVARRAAWPKHLLDACAAQLPANKACFDDYLNDSTNDAKQREQREHRKASRLQKMRLLGGGHELLEHAFRVPFETTPASEECSFKLRTLLLSSTELTSTALRSLAEYVRGNAALNTLELQDNDLGGDSWPLAFLARTLFFSGLRHLNLASAKLDVHDFVTFLDSLRSASLRQLHLSVALANNIPSSDARRAAAAVARLLRHRDGSSAIAEQGVGWAPQLEKLSLNGNEFTWKGVRAIVAAVLGAVPPDEAGSLDAPKPNRVLLHLELFATMSDERPSSDSEEEQGEAERGGVAHRAGRPLSISSSLRAQAQEARAAAAGDAAWIASATPGGVTPPRMGAAEAARRTPILLPGSSSRTHAEQPAEAVTQPSPRRNATPSAGELFEQITRADWRRLLGAQLWRNSSERGVVQSAALAVLVAARVLGCKSRETAPRQDPGDDDTTMEPAGFPFARLPLELRLSVLRHLDERHVLSEPQFGRIVAWASDASTIGYGCGFGLSVPRLDLPSPAERETATQSLLPTHAWDWHASLRRSAPRDWEAELLDKPKDNLGEGWGGGGGPDGTGGAKPTKKREVKPGMAAFWEMTGTETPE